MPTVVIKARETHFFGAPGSAADFLRLFLERAGFAKDHHWELRLESTARCGWDSPPARVVGFDGRVIFLRLKPSLYAAVDHFVRLPLPDGIPYTAATIYRRLKAHVPSFHRFLRLHGRAEKAPQRATTKDAAARRLEANRQRYRRLQTEMKLLDEEYEQITKLLATN